MAIRRNDPAQLSNHATTITGTPQGGTVITYHRTAIVTFDPDVITLAHGGHRSVTTKKKMNQAAGQFGLPFRVFAKGGDWFVYHTLSNEVLPFDGATFRVARHVRAMANG